MPTLASPSVRIPAGQLTITIARYSSPRCLPLTVMQDHRLVEKHARARGLEDIAVNYLVFTTAASARDAIVAGKAQFAATVIALFLFAWNHTRGNLGIKAVGALSSTPSYLFTRHDYVNSVADFRKSDRIAVTLPKQAVFLQMAAAKAFGLGNHEKLDKLGIALPDIDAAAALIAGRVNADLNNPPFSYKEMDTPGLHVVVDSEALFGGSTTSALLLTTTTFEMKYPKAVEAVTAALSEAMAFIRQDRRAAWESYRRLTEERDADIFERMINDSKIIFDREPHGLMKHAAFMRSVGTLENNPTDWQDFFLPSAATGLYGD